MEVNRLCDERNSRPAAQRGLARKAAIAAARDASLAMTEQANCHRPSPVATCGIGIIVAGRLERINGGCADFPVTEHSVPMLTENKRQ